MQLVVQLSESLSSFYYCAELNQSLIMLFNLWSNLTSRLKLSLCRDIYSTSLRLLKLQSVDLPQSEMAVNVLFQPPVVRRELHFRGFDLLGN